MRQASSGMRIAVASLGALHAAAFGWASVVLPWRDWSFFSVASGGLALSYFVIACVAAMGRSELEKVWRAQSFLSLLCVAALGLWLLRSAWRVASLYGEIGQGVAAALAITFASVLLLSVPFAMWGIGWTGGVKLRRRTGIASLMLVIALGAWLARERTVVLGTSPLDPAQLASMTDAFKTLRTEPLTFGGQNLFSPEPAACKRDFSPELVSALLTYRRSLGTGPNTEVETRCVQAQASELVSNVQRVLNDRRAHGRVKVDLIRTTATLEPENTFEPFMLRPGLDGICWFNRCFAPWQMAATSAFVAHTPFPAVPDARMGVSFAKLHLALSSDVQPDEQPAPFRIETHSFLLEDSEVHDIARVPHGKALLTQGTLEQSVAAANRYIRDALRPDGAFNYLLDPHTGEVTMGSLSIPRQAGTTLVLCELGDKASAKTAATALATLAKHEKRIEKDAAVLSIEAPTAKHAVRVGSSALSLVAFLSCRHAVGNQYDALIARLGKTLLMLQQPDGSFWHAVDAVGTPHAERSLYIDGQIMFALVLLEASEPIAGVERAAVHQALANAYTYFAEHYWPAKLGDFFYLEENWHCLAARAALSVHRHEGYERFCIDYARMKSRLLLGEGAHPDFKGAWGFGSVVPPHNTATAGFGEAAAAALKIARQREDSEDVTALKHALEQSLTFLLRNQLGGPSCFACTEDPSVEGAFSEHLASPTIRIDYVQHAMAALGHGGRALGLLKDHAS